jgi:hypothetical protein
MGARDWTRNVSTEKMRNLEKGIQARLRGIAGHPWRFKNIPAGARGPLYGTLALHDQIMHFNKRVKPVFIRDRINSGSRNIRAAVRITVPDLNAESYFTGRSPSLNCTGHSKRMPLRLKFPRTADTNSVSVLTRSLIYCLPASRTSYRFSRLFSAIASCEPTTGELFSILSVIHPALSSL